MSFSQENYRRQVFIGVATLRAVRWRTPQDICRVAVTSWIARILFIIRILDIKLTTFIDTVKFTNWKNLRKNDRLVSCDYFALYWSGRLRVRFPGRKDQFQIG